MINAWAFLNYWGARARAAPQVYAYAQGNVWGAQVHGTYTEHIVYLFHLQNPYTIAYNYLLFMEMFGAPRCMGPIQNI